jgi:hypothetical protein
MIARSLESNSNESKVLLNKNSDEITTKIQKLLKSQWEERLKLFQNNNPSIGLTFILLFNCVIIIINYCLFV